MATNNQPLALSGLASNMDTKTIVQQLMAIERQPQNRLKVKQVTENARQQALKDVQSKLQTLNDAADALSDPALWANTQSLDVNDPTKLGATYVGGAGPGGYQVNITQLARAEQHWYTYATPASNDSITVRRSRSRAASRPRRS